MGESERPYPVLSSRAIVVGGVVLVVLGVGLAVLLMVTLGDGKHADQLDAIKTAGTIVVGTGGAAALWLTARRQRTTEIGLNQKHVDQQAAERALEHTAFDAEARRITDLYGKAVEQIGSDKPAVRLAGFYALERLAQDNSGQRQTIVNVLCAYLRMTSGADPEENEVRQTVQRILTLHLREGQRYWDVEADLSGATLTNASFERCRLTTATFTGVTFEGRTSFDGTRFEQPAPFQGARFTGYTTFDDTAFLHDANFTGATFGGVTWFSRAMFVGRASFPEATFESQAAFTGAKFHGTAAFGLATFTDLADFTQIHCDGELASWLGATFEAHVYFHNAVLSGRSYFPDNADLSGAMFAQTPWIGRQDEPGKPGRGAMFTAQDGSALIVDLTGMPHHVSREPFHPAPGMVIKGGGESVLLPVAPATWHECVKNARAELAARLGRESGPATVTDLQVGRIQEPGDWQDLWHSGWFVAALDALGNPSDTERLSARGSILADLGYPEPAITDLDEVLAAEPDNAPALSARALAHGVLGHTEESERDFAASLAIAPAKAWTFFRRALLTGKETDVRAALEASEPPLTALQAATARSWLPET